MVPILSHVIPLHTFPPYYPKIHFNIILQPTLKPFERSSLSVFRHKICIYPVHFSSTYFTNVNIKFITSVGFLISCPINIQGLALTTGNKLTMKFLKLLGVRNSTLYDEWRPSLVESWTNAVRRT